MNIWKLKAAGVLEKEDVPVPAPVEGKIKVRVTKVLLNGPDAAIFRGEIRTHYPIVPGRYAVGVVAEEGNPYYPKGARVLLHAFVERKDEGTQKRDFSEDDLNICGQTKDGFMRDFMLVSPDDMTLLPDSVSDERALMVHHVGLAKAAIDCLDAQKGRHIVVVGANLFGILTCQLLIYQQAAPILIDSNPQALAFARECGIYYTLPTGNNMLDGVAYITGGRLASGTVYVTSALGNDRAIPFQVSARESNVVLCGPYTENVEFDLGLAMRKQLSLHCVWNCAEYIENAINLVANHAVDFSPIKAVTVKEGDTVELLRSLEEHPERDVNEIIVVSLI